MWDITHWYVGHYSLICGMLLSDMLDVTRWYVQYYSLICGTRLDSCVCKFSHICIFSHRMSSCFVGHDSFICGALLIEIWTRLSDTGWRRCIRCRSWLIHIWGMTHWYVRHGSLMYATWPHWFVGHDSLICGIWLIHIWDMTHWYVRHDSVIRSLLMVVWDDSTTCGTRRIEMWDMTHPYVKHDSWIYGTCLY